VNLQKSLENFEKYDRLRRLGLISNFLAKFPMTNYPARKWSTTQDSTRNFITLYRSERHEETKDVK